MEMKNKIMEALLRSKTIRVVSLALLLLASCAPQDQPSISTEHDQILQAKEFFEDYIITENHRGRSTDSLGRLVDWESAITKELSFADAVKIPLNYSRELYIKGETKSFGLSELNYLLVFEKYSDSQMGAYVVETIPDASYLDTDNTIFTGLVIVKDWYGNFVTGFKHELDGFHRIGLKSVNGIARGRTNYSCTTTTYWRCSYVEIGGEKGSVTCYNEGTQTSCVYHEDTWTGTGDGEDFGPGDEGGGGIGTGSAENEPDFKICNNYIPFDPIPQNDGETSFTGEVTRVHAPAVHTETGEHVEAFWGAWCVTYGTSAMNVNNSTQASAIFKEAWEVTTSEVEIWLNAQGQNPGDIVFSNQFLTFFEINLATLSGGYVQISTGGCTGAVSSTWLTYCN